MKRFIEGLDRGQSTLFPECLGDWVDEDNPVRVIEAFVEALDLGGLGFSRVDPKATGRPSYHPSVLLKLYIYGYLGYKRTLWGSALNVRFTPESRRGSGWSRESVVDPNRSFQTRG